MNNFRIYVEGVTDTKFIQDFITVNFSHISLNSEANIKNTGGWEKLNLFKVDFQEMTDKGGVNLVLFDADMVAKGGGVAKRTKDLEKIKETEAIDFELFFFDNGNGEGAIEDFLENLINPENQVIFDCWENYENCLASKKHPYNQTGNFTIPAKKSKIYTYLEALLPNTKKGKQHCKDANRDFKNINHWNIIGSGENSNPFAVNLYNFLTPYLN